MFALEDRPVRKIVPLLLLSTALAATAFGQATKGRPKGPAGRGATAKTPAPLEYRLLLIIKKEAKVSQDGLPKVTAALSEENIAGARRAFTVQAPEFVRSATRGRVVWNTEVIISEFPLERVSRQGEKGAWVAPDDVARD